MLDVVQYGIDAANAGNLDGTRGQSIVDVGVVGTVDGEQFVIDALQLKLLEGKTNNLSGRKKGWKTVRACMSTGCV